MPTTKQVGGMFSYDNIAADKSLIESSPITYLSKSDHASIVKGLELKKQRIRSLIVQEIATTLRTGRITIEEFPEDVGNNLLNSFNGLRLEGAVLKLMFAMRNVGEATLDKAGSDFGSGFAHSNERMAFREPRLHIFDGNTILDFLDDYGGTRLYVDILVNSTADFIEQQMPLMIALMQSKGTRHSFDKFNSEFESMFEKTESHLVPNIVSDPENLIQIRQISEQLGLMPGPLLERLGTLNPGLRPYLKLESQQVAPPTPQGNEGAFDAPADGIATSQRSHGSRPEPFFAPAFRTVKKVAAAAYKSLEKLWRATSQAVKHANSKADSGKSWASTFVTWFGGFENISNNGNNGPFVQPNTISMRPNRSQELLNSNNVYRDRRSFGMQNDWQPINSTFHQPLSFNERLVVVDVFVKFLFPLLPWNKQMEVTKPLHERLICLDLDIGLMARDLMDLDDNEEIMLHEEEKDEICNIVKEKQEIIQNILAEGMVSPATMSELENARDYLVQKHISRNLF